MVFSGSAPARLNIFRFITSHTHPTRCARRAQGARKARRGRPVPPRRGSIPPPSDRSKPPRTGRRPRLTRRRRAIRQRCAPELRRGHGHGLSGASLGHGLRCVFFGPSYPSNLENPVWYHFVTVLTDVASEPKVVLPSEPMMGSVGKANKPVVFNPIQGLWM